MSIDRWTPPVDAGPFGFGSNGRPNPLVDLSDEELVREARRTREALAPEEVAATEAEMRRTASGRKPEGSR